MSMYRLAFHGSICCDRSELTMSCACDVVCVGVACCMLVRLVLLSKVGECVFVAAWIDDDLCRCDCSMRMCTTCTFHATFKFLMYACVCSYTSWYKQGMMRIAGASTLGRMDGGA